ncbi:SaV-like domain protein [Mycobacterium phage Nanz197]|nr:SaV-like domain protein [Mycobacterium phage Nanz197]
MSGYGDLCGSAQCDVCGKYDAQVFDPCGAMWCRVCDLMGLGALAVSERADEVAEAVGRRFDETPLFGMDSDSSATEAGDPEAWAATTYVIPEPVRQLADLAHQFAAGDDGVRAQAQVWLDGVLPQALDKGKVDNLDDADPAHVWQDKLGAHWGWLPGSGWVAWNSGVYVHGRGAVGPFKVAYRRPVGEFTPMLLDLGGGLAFGCDMAHGPSNDTGVAEKSPTSADSLAGEADEQTGDAVAHPSHYTSSPAKCKACGHPIECIDVTQHMGFCLGNATKYVWRCDLKHDAIEDLRKAIQCIEFEIARREALSTTEG